MTQAHDGSDRSPLDRVMIEDLCQHLACLCDDQLSESDRHRLNRILDEHSGARQYYLRYIAVHSALATTAGSPLGAFAIDAHLAVERLTLERFAGRTMSVSGCELKLSLSARDRRWRTTVRWAASLSAIMLVAAATFWWVQRARRLEDQRVAQHPQLPGETVGDQRLVAEVTYVSASARWQNPNGSYALAARIQSGQTLAFERGQVELTYTSGAKLLLTGPSEFLLQPTGGKLRRGELVARVPKAGHGFTIETPHGKVVDLGTEFGVVVDDFGVSQVSVFEGKVETLPTGTTGRAQEKIELTSGSAIQWTGNSITPIDVQGQRYHRPNDDLPTNRSVRPTSVSLDNDFRGESWDPVCWRTLGEVASSDRGLRLGSVADTAQRPYLLTAQEFDPSLGAITVVCELRFENVHDAEHASFAILTRSADEQSKPGTPWQDMLARSVRCRFKADLVSGEGMLEAGTKYEADREHTNISWGGFSRPQPDTLYRLEMRDDGLNVSFTLSLAENPSVRKTITCRSLFRGTQNFIALEGSSTGTSVVERLMISQDGSPLDDANMFASETAGTSAAQGFHDVDSAQQLDELAPTNAELLLQDDFDGGELNHKIWTTLGDVVLKDGQVQLGLPNDEQHIDTWRARPYLLTKDRFDPADNTLTILGKATFAENFLYGYGGSFAVMTRADQAHGGGPGWENSILRRGVRFNFWPAAYGFDHSLEIHEKPSPNTISLLVAEAFPIAPSSRSYHFRIVDDGRSATLTFLDASDPAIRKSVSYPTSSAMSSSGHIGFESCWGSPVQLDSIRIFRANDASREGRDERE
jgi:hypothetical protein